MPRNGSGVYSAPNNSWNPPVLNVQATNTDWALTQADYVAALTQSVSSDGQTPVTGPLNLTNNKIMNLAPGSATTDAATYGQLLSGISEWVNTNLTPTFVSTTSFTVPGNQTTLLQVGRRIKTINSGVDVYSTILASVFTTVTTVTVVNSSGVLSSGLTAVAVGIVSATNTSAPGYPVFGAYQTVSQAVTSGSNFKIPLSTKEFDTNSIFDTTLSRAVSTIPGYFMVTGQVNGSYSGSGLVYAMIYKNGALYAQGNAINNGNGGIASVQTIVSLSGSDYLELYGVAFGTSTNLINGGTPATTGRLQGTYLRPL